MVSGGPIFDSYGEEVDPSDIEYDERTQGICASCGEECTAITEDHGIGPYEYGSIRPVDIRLVEESPCCGEEVISQEEYDERQESEEREREGPEAAPSRPVQDNQSKAQSGGGASPGGPDKEGSGSGESAGDIGQGIGAISGPLKALAIISGFAAVAGLAYYIMRLVGFRP